ncbi:MAG: AzlC family ABC transporter permease [Lautropia sp.]
MAVVMPGIGAWGVMTGVAMVEAGLSHFEAVLMGLLVFAGSSQLAALPLLAAGAPMWVIVATACCVNLRFIVFSAHLRPYVMHQPLARRLLGAYLFADINYVMFMRRYPQPAREPVVIVAQDAYWLGNGLAGWCVWAATNLLGIALGSSVPQSWGLSFAAILALLGVGGSLVTSRLQAVSATVAGVVAIAAYALPLKLNIVVAIGLAVLVCVGLERLLGRGPADDGGDPTADAGDGGRE